jgi:hypothetical protein
MSQDTAFLLSPKYSSQQRGCDDVSQSQTTSYKFSLGKIVVAAGSECAAPRTTFASTRYSSRTR